MSKNQNLKYFSQKEGRCDHKLILWSGHQKNNFKIVSITFFGQNWVVAFFWRF
jgi:hypothetical protein